MKAAFLALQSFSTGRSSVSVLLLMDNVTVIAFLNKMGGNHSHSSIEVQIATMRKLDRASTDDVYVCGFDPCYTYAAKQNAMVT